MRRLGRALLLASSATAWLSAQQPQVQTPPQPTFRAGATYVEADVVVTDAQGRFVRDLTRDDFRVLEDGTPQGVAVFSMIDIPAGPAARPVGQPTVEPDVSSNAAALDGHVFMIVLDALHVAPAEAPRVKAQVRQFLSHLGPSDLAAVVHIGDGASSQDFTGSTRLLLASVDRFSGVRLESQTVSSSSTAAQTGSVIGQSADDGQTAQRLANDRLSLSAIGKLCTYMANLRGRRKALLLFSDGVDIDTALISGSSGGSGAGSRTTASAAMTVIDAEQTVLVAATRANVSIYTIDPRGLSSGEASALRIAPQDLSSDPTVSVESSITEEIRAGRRPLQLFADATGGLAFLQMNDLSAAFRRILEENSAYYLIGYNSTNAKSDGKFRSIQVTATRAGLTVRTRKGYYAATAAPPGAVKPDALDDLLTNPAPVPGLGLRVSAGALRGPPAGVLVHATIEIDGRDLEFDQANGLFADDLDVVYEAIDHDGKVKASQKQAVTLRLPPASHDVVVRKGIRVAAEFTLPAGSYQIRVAAKELATDRAGSVLHDLEAPDYRKSAFSMSPLFITTSTAGDVPTRGVTAVVSAALPKPTTATREFASSDVLAWFTEVYDNTPARQHAVEFTTTVRDETGAELIRNVDPREESAASSQPAVFDEVTTLPLSKLKPGRYILTVQARSRTGNHVASRDVPFSIR